MDDSNQHPSRLLLLPLPLLPPPKIRDAVDTYHVHDEDLAWSRSLLAYELKARGSGPY